MTQVIGQVDKNGNVKIGNSFRAEKQSTGVYLVVIDTNTFKSEPVIVLTVDATEQKNLHYTACTSLHDVNNNSFKVSIQNLSGKNLDSAFNFIAVTS